MSDLFGYIVLGTLLIVIVAILYIPIYFRLRKKVALNRQICFAGLAGILFVIVFATLLLDIFNGIQTGNLFHPTIKMLNLIPLNWLHETWEMGSDKMITQIAANILMFVPFGFLLPIVFCKLRRSINTLACILFTSFSIELFQYFIGRSADIDDLIQNFIGGATGYLFFLILSHAFGKTRFWKKILGNPTLLT